jgi:methionyl aminopeptidase
MANAGGPGTEVLDDDWTVVTADGSLSAHWEHTVAITPEGPWVLTARSDEPTWPLAEPERVPGAGAGRPSHALDAGVPGW